jgi:m7GpppX diphosphatase
LRGEHIPMLQSMIREGLSAIKRIYGVNSNQIRIFIHYQPQFYHFHVHYTRLENEVGCCCERAHLLSDVIQNLQMDSDFYCKRTISYKLKKGAPLENIIGSYLSSKE